MKTTFYSGFRLLVAISVSYGAVADESAAGGPAQAAWEVRLQAGESTSGMAKLVGRLLGGAEIPEAALHESRIRITGLARTGSQQQQQKTAGAETWYAELHGTDLVAYVMKKAGSRPEPGQKVMNDAGKLRMKIHMAPVTSAVTITTNKACDTAAGGGEMVSIPEMGILCLAANHAVAASPGSALDAAALWVEANPWKVEAPQDSPWLSGYVDVSSLASKSLESEVIRSAKRVEYALKGKAGDTEMTLGMDFTTARHSKRAEQALQGIVAMIAMAQKEDTAQPLDERLETKVDGTKVEARLKILQSEWQDLLAELALGFTLLK